MPPNRVEFIQGAQLAIRVGVAAALSLAVARLLKVQFPIYAMIAAVIVTDLTPSQSRDLGLRRLAATVVGAMCGAACGAVMPQALWSIGVSISLSMLVCHMLPARDGMRVAGYICGIVMLEHSAEPWIYAYLRMIETVIGIVVAWGVSYVPKLIRLPEAPQPKL
jgi:uncharacterized membrane protein YgaE (UPF0421/DUF939 family)